MRTALLSVKERATLIWALKLGALMTAALMPVVLLALFAIRVESRAIRGLVHANNQAAAAITAELVRRDLERSINLGIVFARLPALVAGMTRQDEAAVRAQLQPVVESNGDIDRAFDDRALRVPRHLRMLGTGFDGGNDLIGDGGVNVEAFM
jgi:hypothetical protein